MMDDHQAHQGVREAVERTQQYFLRTQRDDGCWWGELESNPTIEAEYIMLTRFLRSDEGDRIGRVATDIRRRQQPDGSWRMYYGAPGDLSTTIECYFALKLAGDPPDAPHMAQARAFIIEHGGIPKSRVFTKIWLALFGQWDWRATPSMPPEIMLLPKWAPFNIYRFSSWARATIVPMTIVLTLKPTRPPPAGAGIEELRSDGPDPLAVSRFKPNPLSVQGGFLLMDRALRLWRGLRLVPGRRRALRAAVDWIVTHQEGDGSWGLMRIAGDACGHYVEVWVTDVPEWAAQHKMASSFAAAIRDDLMIVAARPGDDSAVVWDKPQALPDTDIEAAYYHLEQAHRRLGAISPRSQERDIDPWRHSAQSEGAAAVIEETLRALGAAAQTDARALHSRDIATVVAHLPGEDQTTVRAHFGDRVTFEDVTMWRARRRAFGNEHRWWRMMPEVNKIATAESTEAITVAAISVVEYASDKIARLHGQRQVNDWITRNRSGCAIRPRQSSPLDDPDRLNESWAGQLGILGLGIRGCHEPRRTSALDLGLMSDDEGHSNPTVVGSSRLPLVLRSATLISSKVSRVRDGVVLGGGAGDLLDEGSHLAGNDVVVVGVVDEFAHGLWGGDACFGAEAYGVVEVTVAGCEELHSQQVAVIGAVGGEVGVDVQRLRVRLQCGRAGGASVVDPVPFQVVALRDRGDGPPEVLGEVSADEVHVIGAAVVSFERECGTASYQDPHRFGPAGQLCVEFTEQRAQALYVEFIEALRHRLSGVVSRVQQVSTEEQSVHSAHSW